MSLQILKPGLHTTVQDLGRVGYQQFGIVVSGAMDQFAMRIANLLVGNDERESGLEMTLIGPTLKWQSSRWIALCGGNMQADIDGVAVPMWRPVFVEKGSVLRMQYAKSGCRAYLAVAGGIDVLQLMGSGSTYTRGQFGGLAGRALQKGDILAIKDRGQDQVTNQVRNQVQVFNRLEHKAQPFYAPRWFASRYFSPFYNSEPVIRVMRGTEYDYFSAQSQHAFFHKSFTLSHRSDRMGYYLTGEPLQLKPEHQGDMISTAVTFGTIQVPPSGEPIILMADRQTTGGYPRIAYVASVDLPLLAQLKPEDRVQFIEVSHRQAEQLYIEREREMNMMKVAIKLKRMEVSV